MKTNQTATSSSEAAAIAAQSDFADFLQEIQRRFEVEKGIKNELISYLCSKELYGEFSEWRKSNTNNSLCGRLKSAAMYVLNQESEVQNA